MSNGTHLLDKQAVNPGDGSVGAVIIYKRSDHSEPRMWNCRVKVSAERRYLYRACSTLDDNIAKQLALKHYWRAKTLKEEGDTAKLWARPFNLVAEEWIRDIEERVNLGIDSLSRLKRCRSGIRLWKEYLGDLAVTQINQENVDGYERRRIKNSKRKLARTTINHEHMALSMCLNWAIKKRYLRNDDKPNCSLGLKKSEKGKRPGFTDDEWRQLQQFMREWAKAEGHNSYIQRQRHQFWNYVMILANSGMRVGEARYIKWKDVSQERKGEAFFVHIWVDGKTGPRELSALPNAWIYLESLKERSKWLDKDDYVFVNAKGEPLSCQKNTFDALLAGCGLLHTKQGEKRTITSLRHFYATRQLVHGNVDVFRLAENMGTSTEQIKNHYSDANQRLFRRHLTQQEKIIELPARG